MKRAAELQYQVNDAHIDLQTIVGTAGSVHDDDDPSAEAHLKLEDLLDEASQQLVAVANSRCAG